MKLNKNCKSKLSLCAPGSGGSGLGHPPPKLAPDSSLGKRGKDQI